MAGVVWERNRGDWRSEKCGDRCQQNGFNAQFLGLMAEKLD
jgi:hypothetical protein